MKSRDGYTLIELLVVIAIIATVAALTLTFLPGAATSAREARGAQDLQSWLSIAKQQAMRDRAPRGLRLWRTTATFGSATVPNAVIECQYLEQPDDFTGGAINTAAGGLQYVYFNLPGGGDLVNGYLPITPWPNAGNVLDPNMRYWSVQLGDNLEVLGTGLLHQIVGFVDQNTVIVSPPLPYPITVATPNYRIVRAARPVGAEKLTLPEGAMIDLGTNIQYPTLTYSNALPPPSDAMFGGNSVDILFSQSGSVISPGLTSPYIHLWVRAPAEGNPGDVYYGAPTLVSVFTRTGFVGAFLPARLSATQHPYVLVN